MGRDDSPLKGRIIFAVGSRRSGTNWLQRILAAAPDVAGMPTESYLFHALEPLRERFQHATPGLPVTGLTFMGRKAFLDALRDFTDSVFVESFRTFAPDARYIVERTPWHVYDVKLIADVYPEAPIVHIIRDGRDVARSLLSKSWGPGTMEAAAEEWRSSVVTGRAAGTSVPRYVEVFYERLLADPEAEIPSLYERVGLELSPDVLEAALLEARSAFNVDPAFPTIARDKWRSTLSPDDLRTFDRIAGELLDELGYERATRPSRGRPRKLVRAAARARSLAKDRVRGARKEVDEAGPVITEPETSVIHELGLAIDAGSASALAELLTPTARLRVVDAGEAWTGRGRDAAARLTTALQRHGERGLRFLSGDVQGNGDMYVVAATYRLDDDSTWLRTLVVTLEGNRIGALAMYRYGLAVTAPHDGSAGAPAEGYM